MDTYIYGMAVRGRTTYHCTDSNGLKMLSLSDKSVSDIISSDMSDGYYVVTSGDKLYNTNSDTDTVTCCDLHGTTQWEFKDTSVLQHPLGISVYNDGNLYVVGFHSHNVVVISLMDNFIDKYCLMRMVWSTHVYLIMTAIPIGY